MHHTHRFQHFLGLMLTQHRTIGVRILYLHLREIDFFPILQHKWLHHPCLPGGLKLGGIATQPLRSRGSPIEGDKITSGYIIPTFPGAQNWAVLLRNPYVLGGPQWNGTKSKVATSPLPSRGPDTGRYCYVTPAFSGVPNGRGQNEKWLHHPYLLRGPTLGGIAT